MGDQLSNNAEALRLFFTDDIYLVPQDQIIANDSPLSEPANQAPLAIEENVVVADSTTSDSPVKPAINFNYLGKNQKKVLILVNDENHDVSDEEGRELLRKLLKAIQLSANDFALLNYAKYNTTNFQELKSFFDLKVLIAFGVNTSQLRINEIIQNQLVEHDETKLILTSNLSVLATDDSTKRILWTSLQKLGI